MDPWSGFVSHFTTLCFTQFFPHSLFLLLILPLLIALPSHSHTSTLLLPHSLFLLFTLPLLIALPSHSHTSTLLLPHSLFLLFTLPLLIALPSHSHTSTLLLPPSTYPSLLPPPPVWTTTWTRQSQMNFSWSCWRNTTTWKWIGRTSGVAPRTAIPLSSASILSPTGRTPRRTDYQLRPQQRLRVSNST